jgi:hypothetical protein
MSTVSLFCKAAIGATGAPTLSSDYSKGIASITRNATGDYTLALSEPYVGLLSCHPMMLEADDTDITFQIISEDVAGTSPNVKIGAHAAATPTDPPDGSTLYVHIIVRNSSV